MQYTSVKNTFRPSALVPNPYGWTRSSTYKRPDVPSAWVDKPARMTSEEVAQSLAYEWMQSNQVGAGYSNPPFLTGAAGRLHPALQDAFGQPARILRGFIRRANYEVTDEASKARLYFMFNPEVITRDYVSYLDQASLDPFNTVFQSGNLVAPPSFMNFRFDLFFDRQAEAMAVDHPGVLVDYQFFDLVVRNVVPSDPGSLNNQLPDNGVMMVNPRDITVVFSPQISVQGRPINAQVSFEKFTHRMTPVRMRISLEMRVVYFGPLLEQTEYRMQQSEFDAELSVPEKDDYTFNLTFNDIVVQSISKQGGTFLDQKAAAGGANAAANSPAGSGEEGSNIVPVAGITGGLDAGLAPIATQMIQAAAAAGISLTGRLPVVRSTGGCAEEEWVPGPHVT